MIHAFEVTASKLQLLGVSDWWTITSADLDSLASSLLGIRVSGGWVRRGEHSVVIASQKRGSLASKLEAELLALAADCKKLLAADGSDTPLRVAACYHLRFENIHPLGEGNGRMGRTILAAQLHQAYRIPPEEFLGALSAQEMDYLAVFAGNKPEIMFELLLDLLAQLTGQVIAPESIKLPFSILPLYPDRRPIVKGIAQPVRPAQKNHYFRKFG